MGVLDILTHNDLDSALKNKQLQVAFQPCISLSKLSALGAEAFLRWQHPALGLLPANLFMPFARAQGRTREVALFMLRETLRSAAEWRRAGLDWKAYVNVDGADLADGMLADSIALLLCEFDLPAETLTLDVRESDLAERGAQILPHLTALRTMGVGIALDTVPGEAPLQDLSGLPLTEMKIAGPAIIRFIESTKDTGLGRILNRLHQARQAGLTTCAVRVESEATLWALQRVGFDAAQGAYISPPIALRELVRWDGIWRQAAEQLSAQKTRASRAEPQIAAEPQEQLADRFESARTGFEPDADGEGAFDEALINSAIDAIAPDAFGTDLSHNDESEFSFDAVPDSGVTGDHEDGVAHDPDADTQPDAPEGEFSFDAPIPVELEAPEEPADEPTASIAQSFAPPARAAYPIAEPAPQEPPASVTIQRKAKTGIALSAPTAPTAAAKRGRKGAPRTESTAKAAPLEPVLIERRIPGLDKPIAMQVAASSREHKGLFGRLLPGAKK